MKPRRLIVYYTTPKSAYRQVRIQNELITTILEKIEELQSEQEGRRGAEKG